LTLALLSNPHSASAQSVSDPSPASVPRQPRGDRGLLIAGSIIFGSLTLANIGFGISEMPGDPAAGSLLMVPVVGPIAAAAVERPSGAFINFDGLHRAAEIADGVVQGLGLGLLLAGIFYRPAPPDLPTVRTADRRVFHWTITPGASGTSAGATLSAVWF
jgi:hypothetical protein